MKFGAKIFLMSFSLLLMSIFCVGVILINNSFSLNIEQEKEKDCIQINMIAENIKEGISNFGFIANSYMANQTTTKVYMGNRLIFTNVLESDISVEEKLKKDIKEDIVVTTIEDYKLYMVLMKDSYTIITISDISSIYQHKNRQIHFFIQFSLVISILCAFLLSFCVHFMTRKIQKLNLSAKEIKNGNYAIAIPPMGSDEIGEFAVIFEQMANSIQNNIQEIEKVSENRRIFIGNLTHEIRTPLTSIIGYSSLIKNQKVKDKKIMVNYATKIYEEGKYIEALRDKLMYLLTLENDSLSFNYIDIQKIVVDCSKEILELFPHVEIQMNLQKNVMHSVDSILFKSLFFNLIKNAIKASATPVIAIHLTNDFLLIKDNGCGIPSTEIERIKEPFYTLNKDRNREETGLGLGLTLCFKIVEVHGWKMIIESTLGQGTTVKIEMRDKI